MAELTVTQPDDHMIQTCAELRHACRQTGHALAEKVHDGDRWIAAAAIRLGVSLVSHDRIFAHVPDLKFLTTAPEK